MTSAISTQKRHTFERSGLATTAVKLLAAFYCTVPFAWMALTALKSPQEALAFSWLPSEPNFDQFVAVFQDAPMGRYLWNSTYITALVVVGRLAVCALAGYAFARLEFFGKQVAFGFLMGAMLLPSILTVIPLYAVYQDIGWLDTHWPLIIPPIVTSSIGVFWMRQFFLTVPRELEEAAKLDGCGPIRTFGRIMLPLSTGNLAALGLFTAISAWNEFFTAVVFLNSPELYTLPVGLAFFASDTGANVPIVMAATLISILPILVGYVFLQRLIIDRMIDSGISN